MCTESTLLSSLLRRMEVCRCSALSQMASCNISQCHHDHNRVINNAENMNPNNLSISKYLTMLIVDISHLWVGVRVYVGLFRGRCDSGSHCLLPALYLGSLKGDILAS